MLPDWKRAAIKADLLADAASHRDLAKAHGVARGTIAYIAAEMLRQPDEETPALPPPDEQCPPRRCKGCGALVHPPCYACAIRRLRRNE